MVKKKAHTRYRLKPTEGWPKGEIVPGVTTIIDGMLGWNKRTLMAWARREALKGNDPDLIAKEAADSGTCAHKMVECHIKGEEPDLSDFTQNQIDKAETGFLAFLEWEEKQELEYVHLELPVVSEQYRFGGTVDMIAKKNGSLWMIDLKTSKGIYPEYKIQLAAYSLAFEEQESEDIDEWHLLQLSKENGSFQHHVVSESEIADGRDVFLICRKLYDLKKKF